MNLQLLAKSASQLFSPPEICIKLQDLIYNPDSSMSDIAQLISVDPSLSARLLKIANSSFYSFPSQIDSLSRAITLIGTADLYNLALATSTPEAFGKLENKQHLDINRFWRHSVNTGITSRILANQLGFRHSEGFFLAGLFHNLGKLVVLEQMPDMFLAVKNNLCAEKAPWVIERDVLDHTYAEVGEALLSCWNMPTNLLDMVGNQHKPEEAMDPAYCAIIHITSRAISQVEYHEEIGYDFIASIKPEAMALVKLDHEQIAEAVQGAEASSTEMMANMNLA